MKSPEPDSENPTSSYANPKQALLMSKMNQYIGRKYGDRGLTQAGRNLSADVMASLSPKDHSGAPSAPKLVSNTSSPEPSA